MVSFVNMLWLIHMAALLGLAIYGMHRIWLLILWKKTRKDAANGFFLPEMDKNPRVTIQLPLYNERFVVKRLIDAASNLDWPKDCLEIQVLDDSSDETRALVDERVLYWQGRGMDIKAIRRKNRNGFKAGALAFGMASAKGEFIAVFDADFVPGKDFLRRTVSCFTDAKIGMVQCRWAFLNEEHSWLTRIQGVLLSAHFRIEHHVRHQYGLCFNFNGTAGIWRKAAIFDAGGFQSDTVTEDLDISYRAQLNGWRFVYLDDYVVPSELPTTMAAFRTQQKRWTKGSIQTARKLLPLIVASKIMTPLAKVEAFAHLLANTGWLLCMVLILTLYPAVQINETVVSSNLLQVAFLLFLFSSGAVLLYFFVYAVAFESSSKSVLPLIPVLSIGMAPVLALSVISGMLTKGGIFHRTPKYGMLGRTRLPGLSLVYKGRSTGAMMINIPVFIYTLLPVWFLCQTREWTVVFPLLFPLGVVWVIIKDIQDDLVCKNECLSDNQTHLFKNITKK